MRTYPLTSLSFALAIAALVGSVCALSGLTHDQAIFFQAGLREFFGQGAYRDYFVPQGPIAGFVLSLFMRVAPTTGWAFVLASGALNAAATLAVWKILNRVKVETSSAFWASLAAAVWFLPVFGSFYNDHLAYVFVLWGFYFFLVMPNLYLRMGGMALFLAISYHTKQSLGVMAVASFLATLVMTRQKSILRSLFVFSGVSILAHLILLSVFHGISHFSNYSLYSILCPLWYAKGVKSVWSPLQFLLFPWGIHPWKMLSEPGHGRIVFYPLVLLAYWALYCLLRSSLLEEKRLVLLFSVLSTIWCGSLLSRFHGQLFLGMGIVIGMFLEYQNLRAFWGSAIIGLGIAQVLASHSFFKPVNSDLTQSSLYPIQIEQESISTATADVIRYLKSHDGSFGTVGPNTYLVSPALGRAGDNPSVYYEIPLTIPVKSPSKEIWQRQTISAFEKAETKYLVLDQNWRNKTEQTFPELVEYLDRKYTPVLLTAGLRVLERN